MATEMSAKSGGVPASAGVEPAEIIMVDEEDISCDGGGGALGHPLVFLTVEKSGFIDCPYCGRRFILEGGPADPNRLTNAAAAAG